MHTLWASHPALIGGGAVCIVSSFDRKGIFIESHCLSQAAIRSQWAKPGIALQSGRAGTILNKIVDIESKRSKVDTFSSRSRVGNNGIPIM